MEFKTEVIFVASKEFRSKTGKDFKVVEILEIDKKTNQGIFTSFFVETMPSIVSNLKCGDVVEVVLVLNSAGEKPSLKDITKKISDSPYFK